MVHSIFLTNNLQRAGNMNMGIYEADCEFADPFVSFKGLKRFKQNVSNLGSFMEESSLKITDWQEYEVHNLLGAPLHFTLAHHLHYHYLMDVASLNTRRLIHKQAVETSSRLNSLSFFVSAATGLCLTFYYFVFVPCRIGSTLSGVSIASWDFLGDQFWQVYLALNCSTVRMSQKVQSVLKCIALSHVVSFSVSPQNEDFYQSSWSFIQGSFLIEKQSIMKCSDMGAFEMWL